MSTTEPNNNMETPPSSPPTSAKQPGNPSMEPPALTGTTSLSSEALGSPQRRSSELSAEEIGHRRSGTPSTPVTTSEVFPPAPRAYSTPGRSGPSGPGMPAHILHAHQGHLTSDLTPVISNSNATYVDTQVPFQGARPGMPGLTTTSEGDEEFMVVSPPGGPRGAGRLSSRAAAALGANEKDICGSGRGLQQRRSRMPLPRAGLPPAKRSSFELGPGNLVSSSNVGKPADILRLGSVGSTDSSLQGEHLGISPSTPSTATMEGAEGLGLVGERLAMPSYSSMYSEDESSVDTSGDGSGKGRAGIFQQKGKQDGQEKLPEGLAPIELRPDRKFFSFQGASQYKRSVGSSEDDDNAVPPATRLETIPSPSRIGRPPASPVKGGQPMLATMHQDGQSHQYLPVLRSQHGVKEMAKAEELDAIFKAPRRQRQQPHVVSPHTPASVADLQDDAKQGGVPMMIIDGHQQPQPSLSYPPREDDDEGEDAAANIPPAYPVESQWSIPSIRLANHVNNSLLDSHGYSYGDFSEYTDDDGASLGSESYYNFLADDDDTASLNSSVRSWRQFRRKESMDRLAAEGNVGMASPPATVESNSILEKFRGISIENNATLDSTFDTSATETSAIENAAAINDAGTNSPPPMLAPPPLPRRDHHADIQSPLLNVPAMDRQPAQAEESRVQRSGRRGGSSRRRKEGAAEKWIQDLQSQSNDVQLIAESASSKFLTGEGATMSLGCAGGFGQGGSSGLNVAATGASAGGMNAQDVTKALGMPHPLCRSSTIEAGPFTVHRVAGFGQASDRDNVGGLGLESNNSIALTSSGSGD